MGFLLHCNPTMDNVLLVYSLNICQLSILTVDRRMAKHCYWVPFDETLGLVRNKRNNWDKFNVAWSDRNINSSYNRTVFTPRKEACLKANHSNTNSIPMKKKYKIMNNSELMVIDLPEICSSLLHVIVRTAKIEMNKCMHQLNRAWCSYF